MWLDELRCPNRSGLAFLHELLTELVPDAVQVQREREALLVAVVVVRRHGINPVEGFLRGANDLRVLRRDRPRDFEQCVAQVVPRNNTKHRTEVMKIGGCHVLSREEHAPHDFLRHEPRQVRRAAQGTTVDLRETEVRVVRSDHQVRGSRETDAAAQAEAVDATNRRNLTLVDRLECGEAPAVHAEDAFVAGQRLHLFDVDAGAEAAAFGPEDHNAHILVSSELRDGLRNLEPVRNLRRIDWRHVDDDLGDSVGDAVLDSHQKSRSGFFPAVAPPSITKSAPVQYELSSDARNTMSDAISSGVPMRGSGVLSNVLDSSSSGWSNGLAIFVSMPPGHTVFTRIPYRPSSMAAVFVIPRTANLLA